MFVTRSRLGYALLSQNIWKKFNLLFIVPSMLTKVGLCCNPEGPELHKAKAESDTQKTEKRPEGCSHLGLLGWRVCKSYYHFLVFYFLLLSKESCFNWMCWGYTHICFSSMSENWNFIWEKLDSVVSLVMQFRSLDCSKTACKDSHSE